MEAAVQIDADPAHVWSILTDFPRYREWNPFFVEAAGVAVQGKALQMVMRPKGKETIDFKPLVLTVAAPRTLVWRGRVLMPGIFDGVHEFIITPIGPGKVTLTQREKFGGILVPFINYDPFLESWHLMNKALKARAESANPTATAIVN